MKSENRLSKILEKRILQDEDPKTIAQIDKFLNNLEVVFVKWAKAHPNWKETEEQFNCYKLLIIKELQKAAPFARKSLTINEI